MNSRLGMSKSKFMDWRILPLETVQKNQKDEIHKLQLRTFEDIDT